MGCRDRGDVRPDAGGRSGIDSHRGHSPFLSSLCQETLTRFSTLKPGRWTGTILQELNVRPTKNNRVYMCVPPSILKPYPCIIRAANSQIPKYTGHNHSLLWVAQLGDMWIHYPNISTSFYIILFRCRRFA